MASVSSFCIVTGKHEAWDGSDYEEVVFATVDDGGRILRILAHSL